MSATDVLRAARAAGILIEIDGNDLALEAAAEPPANVLAALSSYKHEIVALLRPDTAAPDEVEEERTAIVEHDGRIPRSWAEGFARLHPDRPSGDVPLLRWQQFVDDIGKFLDGGWAEKAAALNWGPLALFGCDRDKPFARVDCSGLLWLLNGRRLVALSENTAAIETRTGARQTFRRRPAAVGDVVLAWELGAAIDTTADRSNRTEPG
jgi:hypothetical protein